MSIDLIFPTEIIIEIISHLDFPYSWPPPIERNRSKKPFDDGVSKKALHAMALTCRSFTSLALDLLWEYMDDILPLFRLLSSWDDNLKVICKPVTGNELDKFNSYARRIKYYFRRPMGEEEIPVQMYCRMLDKQTACLLPGLKYLAIQDGITVTFDQEAMFEVVHLLSPQLSHLFIKDSGLDLEARDFVYNIIRVLPLKTQITHLSLACPLTSATFDQICQIRGLHYLSLSDTLSDLDPILIGSDLFHSLSASNHTLREISLKPYHFEAAARMSSVITLPVLKKFSCSLTTNDLRVIQQLICMTKLPSLERVEFLFIPVQAATSDISWPEFWDTVTETAALREIVLDNDHSIHLNMPMSSLSDSVRHDLTSLHVVGRVFCQLTPTDWTSFVRSSGLRNLESLVLVEDQVELVGFQVLIDIASNMTLLNQLTISLDTSLPPLHETVPILNHGLRWIDFSRTTFEYPLTFARCLDRLFSKLESIECRFQVKRRKGKIGPDFRRCRQVQSALLELRGRKTMGQAQPSCSSLGGCNRTFPFDP